MAYPDIIDYTDNRNKKLWGSLNEIYNISLEFHNDSNFSCFIRDNIAIIFIPHNNKCKDSFTHELLHIELKRKKILIGNHLILLFRSYKVFSGIYTQELIEHISNCLDHYKMFPIYLELGFDRYKFIFDYTIPKCTDIELNALDVLLSSDSENWMLGADLFVGKFFGIKACPNNTIDYSEMLLRLKQIDNSLFNILNEFWNSWQIFDIDNYDIIFNNYYEFCEIFISDLKEWTIKRINNN